MRCLPEAEMNNWATCPVCGAQRRVQVVDATEGPARKVVRMTEHRRYDEEAGAMVRCEGSGGPVGEEYWQ